MSESVAVIDVGSNSIKLLVASKEVPGSLIPVFAETIETRISAGISNQLPKLCDRAIEAGTATIDELVDLAQQYSPETIQIVATSAVREATNGADLIESVQKQTGLRIRILKGQEEATYIGRGVACDPTLKGTTNFLQLDIGGGSLELIRFEDSEIKQAISLPLGAVRLTERFIKDRDLALNKALEDQIHQHVLATLSVSNFHFEPIECPLVATGGAFVIARAIIAAQNGNTIERHKPYITRAEIVSLKKTLSACTLHERISVPHLPASRADILPTALITIAALLDHSQREGVTHSFFNLRFGIAAELLGLS